MGVSVTERIAAGNDKGAGESATESARKGSLAADLQT